MKSGILLIDKPKNITSRDVVNIICKKFNTRKVGHAGTLDPIATGLLIVCVNKATSLIELLTSEDKEYVAKVKLGFVTDTLDITGNILEENYNYVLDKDTLINVLNSFIGTYEQEVPIYSAIKVNGKKLYEYARKNEKVCLPKRSVTINDIELLSLEINSFTFRVSVSKGTYIRSLIRDIGNRLNILMTMEELTRTKIDNYTLSNAINLEKVTTDSLISINNFFDFPKINIEGDLKKHILNGGRIKDIYNNKYVMFMDNNKLLAIYKNNSNGELCMFKYFNDED